MFRSLVSSSAVKINSFASSATVAVLPLKSNLWRSFLDGLIDRVGYFRAIHFRHDIKRILLSHCALRLLALFNFVALPKRG